MIFCSVSQNCWMFIIFLSLLLFLVFPYLFSEDGNTVFLLGLVCKCDMCQIILEIFAFINSYLVLIFHLIVLSDHL